MKVRSSVCPGDLSRYAHVPTLEPSRGEPHSLFCECPDFMVRHELPDLKTTAGTLECVLLVTSKHRGFVRRRLDQAHLPATRKAPHVDHPFAFNNSG